jgi:hypothetical protein
VVTSSRPDNLEEMRWSSKAAVLALALLLLFSSTNCVMACAFAPCVNNSSAQQSMPPCHNHHSPSHQAPPACAHPLTIAGSIHSLAHVTEPDFATGVALPPASLPALSLAAETAVLGASSPPGYPALSSVILRI